MTYHQIKEIITCLALSLILASCGQKEQKTKLWYGPLADIMAQHEQLLQSNPDSMMLLINQYQGKGNAQLTEQWKNLLLAKCDFMKGNDPECKRRILASLDYCEHQAQGADRLKLRSYANNLYGVLLLTHTDRKAAAQRFQLAYQDIMQLPQPNDVVDICINAADVARQMGHLADASSWYRRANFLADSLHVTSSQNSILAGLGQVYNDLKNYRLAHYYFGKAEREYPPKNAKDIHFFYNSWGNVYSSEGKPDKALLCFLKAQKAARKLEQPILMAVVDANLGQTYMELNQLDSAAKYLDKACAFFMVKPDMNNDLQFYLDGLNAQLAIKRGELREAHQVLFKPYVLSRMSPNYMYLHHRSLAELYEKEGDYHQALYYQKLTSQYDDSLRNATMLSSVSENELRFKQDTAIIRRDVKLQTAKTEAKSMRIIYVLVIGLLVIGLLALIAWARYKSLRSAHEHQEEMKRMLALKMENVRNRFSPHFVFNVLNIFVSGIPNGVNIKPLRLLIQVLRSNLLTCDKIAVPLNEELQMVTNYSYLRHETNPLLPLPEFEIAEEVDHKQMLPSMIIQIPVENALKHAFSDGDMGGRTPQLKVKITMEEERLHIQVRDNGCGYSRADARKSKSSAVSTGTGLRILHSTIDMLNGSNAEPITFQVKSAQAATGDEAAVGTVVDIVVPCHYDFSMNH